MIPAQVYVCFTRNVYSLTLTFLVRQLAELIELRLVSNYPVVELRAQLLVEESVSSRIKTQR